MSAVQRLINESATSTTSGALRGVPREQRDFEREYDYYRVKRGLRNQDGTGVMAGLTRVATHGYLIDDGDKVPDEGRLSYPRHERDRHRERLPRRGRFAFEEVVWLLIFGKLPDKRQYGRICQRLLYENRELPEYFPEDVIMKTPRRTG